MDIRQIRLFCRIVDRRSFSLAADEMHITQPAASQQIRSLERELKTTLLDRSRRTVVPTDSGQVLYRYGREILDLHERSCTEILDLSELVKGRVMVGASTGPGEHVLPAMLTQFKEEYPGVSISLHVDDTHAVLERVLAREFEIGAVGAVTPRPARVAEPLARDEIVLVCSPSHPWSRSRRSCSSTGRGCAPWSKTICGAPARAPRSSTWSWRWASWNRPSRPPSPAAASPSSAAGRSAPRSSTARS